MLPHLRTPNCLSMFGTNQQPYQPDNGPLWPVLHNEITLADDQLKIGLMMRGQANYLPCCPACRLSPLNDESGLIEWATRLQLWWKTCLDRRPKKRKPCTQMRLKTRSNWQQCSRLYRLRCSAGSTAVDLQYMSARLIFGHSGLLAWITDAFDFFAVSLTTT